jgi:hypothetical protein
MNRELRRKIRANMIRNNNYAWNQYLPELVENINRQVKSRNKLSANELWSQGYNPQPRGLPAPEVINQLDDQLTRPQLRDHQQALIVANAVRRIGQGRQPQVCNVGDLVRVKMTTASSTMREARKNNLGYNKVSIHYTTQIFRVYQAFRYPPDSTRQDQYIIANLDGLIVTTEPNGNTPKRYFGSDLIFVPPNNVQTSVTPQNIFRALQFNRLA